MSHQTARNNSKQIYSTYSMLSSSGMSDDVIIEHLIDLLKTNNHRNNLTLASALSEFYVNGEIDFISIIELIGLTHQKKKGKISISNTDERKHNGIYYTNYSIAKQITKDTLSLFGDKFDPTKLAFLEPCSGIGIFAITYLDEIFQKDRAFLDNAQAIINNMYYADIDEDAIKLLKIILPAYLKARYKIDVKIPNKNVYVGDVLFRINSNDIQKNDLKIVFNKPDGFDVVLTNPPYKLLKANANKYDKENNYKEQITEILKLIRKNKIYKYNSGTLNLYKLFVEEILENYTNQDGKIGLLIPSTLLSDKQSYSLRNRILNQYSLSVIYTIPEKNNFFLDITQAFCFFALDKSKSTDQFSLKNNIFESTELDNKAIPISKSKISSISTLQEIVTADEMGWKILNKIHKYKKLKEIPSITNLRGELDLTLDKHFITSDGTEYRLLRGNGIKEFRFDKDDTYVQNNFINKLNGKAHYLSSDRLVCQQVSNINLKKRLKFTKVPQKIVLGNSCNFIVTNNDTLFSDSEITLDYLLGVMNSLLLDWRFQLTSSNNHIGNYELNELPLVIPTPKQRLSIEDLARKLVDDPSNDEYRARLNGMVFNLYGLNLEEARYVLDKHKDSKFAQLTEKWIES